MLQGVDGKGASDLRSSMVSADFLRNAISAPSIVVTETFTPAGSETGWSREVKLSTNGLSKALSEFQKGCGERKFLDAPAVKYLDAPDVSRRR